MRKFKITVILILALSFSLLWHSGIKSRQQIINSTYNQLGDELKSYVVNKNFSSVTETQMNRYHTVYSGQNGCYMIKKGQPLYMVRFAANIGMMDPITTYVDVITCTALGHDLWE